MGYHVWHLRFHGVHILSNPAAAFPKVQMEFQNPWIVAFYAIAIVAASWHFAYGVWLFCCKWGIIVGGKARKRFGVVCLAIGLLFAVVGLYTLRAFLVTPQQPITEPGSTQVESSQVYR